MNRNGISSLGDNGICIPLSTSSYDFSESERDDEQYNEKQEEQLRIIHTHIEQKEKTGRNGLKAVSM